MGAWKCLGVQEALPQCTLLKSALHGTQPQSHTRDPVRLWRSTQEREGQGHLLIMNSTVWSLDVALQHSWAHVTGAFLIFLPAMRLPQEVQNHHVTVLDAGTSGPQSLPS